jgi:hypothetical protein
LSYLEQSHRDARHSEGFAFSKELGVEMLMRLV